MAKAMCHPIGNHSVGHITARQAEIARHDRNVGLLATGFSVFSAVLLLAFWLEAVRNIPWFLPYGSARWLVPTWGVYLNWAMLVTYATSNAITRWCKLKRTTRRGGRWVMIWWGSCYLIILLSMFTPQITLPPLLPKQCVAVLVVFFGSQSAKAFFINKMRENNNGLF